MNHQTLVLIVCALGLLAAAIWLAGKKTKKAAIFIMEELQERGAMDPESAAPLDFGHKSLMSMGLRDYRPKVLKSLVQAEIVKVNDQGLFYLARPEAIEKLKS